LKKQVSITARIIPVVIICLLCIAAAMPGCTTPEEPIDWDVTLVGSEGQQMVVSYDEIKAMPSYEGRGGFFTTVGIVNGPYKAKGVLLEDLCDLVGGVTSSDVVMVSAPDGYLMAFDYDQVMGNINTYDLDLHDTPHGELKLILMYEQDGKPVPDNDGKPLRLAIIGPVELLTEGHYWVKWVDKIEVKHKTESS
jgi:DMSO/TMAO reductase YedYZ molybdopterin-dependent catalytic subunit